MYTNSQTFWGYYIELMVKSIKFIIYVVYTLFLLTVEGFAIDEPLDGGDGSALGRTLKRCVLTHTSIHLHRLRHPRWLRCNSYVILQE